MRAISIIQHCDQDAVCKIGIIFFSNTADKCHHIAQCVGREIFGLCWYKQEICRSKGILGDCAKSGGAVEKYVIVWQIGSVCDGFFEDGGVISTYRQEL